MDETSLEETDETLESTAASLETQKKLLHKSTSENAGKKPPLAGTLVRPSAGESAPLWRLKSSTGIKERSVSVDGLRALSNLNSNATIVDAEELIDLGKTLSASPLDEIELSGSDDSDGPPSDDEIANGPKLSGETES